MDTQIWINPKRFRSVGEHTEVDGVDVHVQLSPFNTPTGICGRHLPKEKVFEIKFDYMDSEPVGSERTEGEVRFIEGRYSGKLLAIRIPVDAKPYDSVGLIRLQTEIVQALEKRAEGLNPRKDRRLPFGSFLNSKAAQVVIANEPDFQSVAKAISAS